MLEHIDLFRGLAPSDIRELEAKADVVTYSKGNIIIEADHIIIHSASAPI